MDRTLRVVQLIKGLDIGGWSGGADVFGANLAGALKQSTMAVDARLVVFFRTQTPAEKRYQEQLKACGVDVVFLQDWQGRTSLNAYAGGMKKLWLYLKKERIDILHSHFHVGTLMAAGFRLVGRVPRTARTVHVDREWLRGWNGVLQQALIRLFIFVLFPLLIDLECGVSRAAVDVLNSRWLVRLLRKKAHVVYNSVAAPDYARVVAQARQAKNPKQPGRFVIGTVGRLTDQKGHSDLLQAIPALVRAVPEVEFWWVGDGPLRDSLSEAAQTQGVLPKVQFLGIRNDVPALLDAMDLFVLPSIYEGLPTVVLESIAHGVPVVGTAIPGTREIIEDGINGWLVPARNGPALAGAILQAIYQPEERVRRAEAAVETLRSFTVERAAQQYAALYREFFA